MIRSVLFVLPEYPPHAGGGIITFYRNLLPLLAGRGIRVRAIVGSGVSAEFSSYANDGVQVESLELVRIRAYEEKFGRYDAVPLLRRHLAAAWAAWEQAGGGDGFDVVETTDWGLLFVPWIVKKSVPAVVQLHGSVGQISQHEPRAGEEVYGALVRLMEREVLAASDELQTYSSANAAFWKRQTSREVNVIRPGFFAGPTQANHRNNPPVVVGRVQTWKGPDVLCRALDGIQTENVVNWVGRDTEDPFTRASMSKTLAGLYPATWGRTIRPVGARSPLETAEMQRSAKFAIVPSLWDVFNFTVVESMACGATVISSDGAGASELITSAYSGYVYPAQDAAALRASFEEVGHMPASRLEEIGTAARATVLDRLDPERQCSERLASYAAVTGRRSELSPWTLDAVSPESTPGTGLRFLDGHPLREIARYAARRAARKVRRNG